MDKFQLVRRPTDVEGDLSYNGELDMHDLNILTQNVAVAPAEPHGEFLRRLDLNGDETVDVEKPGRQFRQRRQCEHLQSHLRRQLWFAQLRQCGGGRLVSSVCAGRLKRCWIAGTWWRLRECGPRHRARAGHDDDVDGRIVVRSTTSSLPPLIGKPVCFHRGLRTRLYSPTGRVGL